MALICIQRALWCMLCQETDLTRSQGVGRI
ncbi:hypothetical protein TSAR_013332 [Trichomalopsis sarcophagae]|uniref:Uncharacterized protein n=1 Tax=Trichomalopsis sarcophagae TaxID=543379 RepID=A0A232EQU8_9HYME|nr:hypothetical protein TSAR_013332 [Trichomalopsis sarcophagae]